MTRLIVAGLALALTGSAVAPPALAQDGNAEFAATTLNVSATGEVRARPDVAEITVGVENEGANAADALLQNRRQMAAALSALRAQGVAEADIQTDNLALQPQYVFDNGKPRRLTGYQATNSVTVRLHDLARVGQVVDALVAAGANEINSISFQISDRTAAENAAREAALKALQAKAELYAQASGYRIARLVHLDEVGAPTIMPMRRMVAPMMVAGPMAPQPTQVAAGELSVSETVSAQYQLTR